MEKVQGRVASGARSVRSQYACKHATRGNLHVVTRLHVLLVRHYLEQSEVNLVAFTSEAFAGLETL